MVGTYTLRGAQSKPEQNAIRTKKEDSQNKTVVRI